MGLMKRYLMEKLEKEREEERQQAVEESTIGEACECSRCGAWFPQEDSWDMNICPTCWDNAVADD